MFTSLPTWLASATTYEMDTLAKAAGTSRAYLYQLGYGTRRASADLASRLEKAAAVMHRKSKGRLPLLPRGEVCAACAECPFYKPCKEKK